MGNRITIVNFVTDDKFIDGVIAFNEQFSPKNVVHVYIFVCNGNPHAFSLIKNTAAITQLTVEEVIPFLREKHVNAVLLHSLYSLPLEITPMIPSNICVIWSSWGYDIYSMMESVRLVNINLFRSLTKNFLKDPLVRPVNEQPDETYQNAVQRIDYLSTVLPEEYDLIPSSSYFRPKRLHYTYITPKEVEAYQNANVPQLVGENILIGNSGAPTNNHLDIFEKLSDLDIGERKIYCPLSYAGYPIEYKEEVIRRGKTLFGASFVPLLEFMDKETYFQMMSSCGYVLFGHIRQQALGNVREMLLKGCKVFLDKDSPMYRHFLRLGVTVFSIQDDVTSEQLKTGLDENDASKNIEILKSDMSPDKYYSEMSFMADAIRRHMRQNSFLTHLRRSFSDIIHIFAHNKHY